MDNPELYLTKSSLQVRDVTEFLEQNLKLVNWNKSAKEMILDIGCAVGNVTCNILMPMMPKSVEKIVAVDINEKMIMKAREIYKTPNVEFKVLDIASDIPDEMKGKFDHIFSFFCFHWIQNQRKMMGNLYNLLKPKGDILFILPQKCEQFFVVNRNMSSDPRFRRYMTDIEDCWSPYQRTDFPVELLTKYLEDAGFRVKMCEVQDTVYEFPNKDDLSDFFEAINPFVNRMNEDLRKQFMEENVKRIEEISAKQNQYKKKYVKYYSLLLAYAEKMDK